MSYRTSTGTTDYLCSSSNVGYVITFLREHGDLPNITVSNNGPSITLQRVGADPNTEMWLGSGRHFRVITVAFATQQRAFATTAGTLQ